MLSMKKKKHGRIIYEFKNENKEKKLVPSKEQ